jgi:hypothetical protein
MTTKVYHLLLGIGKQGDEFQDCLDACDGNIPMAFHTLAAHYHDAAKGCEQIANVLKTLDTTSLEAEGQNSTIFLTGDPAVLDPLTTSDSILLVGMDSEESDWEDEDEDEEDGDHSEGENEEDEEEDVDPLSLRDLTKVVHNHAFDKFAVKTPTPVLGQTIADDAYEAGKRGSLTQRIVKGIEE